MLSIGNTVTKFSYLLKKLGYKSLYNSWKKLSLHAEHMKNFDLQNKYKL